MSDGVVSVLVDPLALRWPGTQRRIVAQYVDLDRLEERSQVEYVSLGVMGRMEQIKSYAGTSNREIPLTFQFRPDSEADRDEMMERVLLLESLKYPYMADDGYHSPPSVVLSIGDFLSMRALVTTCDITWTGGIDVDTLRPMGADVNLVFTSVFDRPFRNMQTSFKSPSRYETTGDPQGGTGDFVTPTRTASGSAIS